MVGIVRGKMKGISIAVLVAMLSMVLVEAQQFGVVHNYAHLEGAPRDGHCATPEYFATLKAHHRRRERQLLASVDFPLHGDADVFSTGLYFTQITLGTPPGQYNVQVDTGSDVLWLDCVPCTGCPPSTDIPGVTLHQYDPALSTTDIVLPCTSENCGPASNAASPSCDGNGACAYEVLYGDGSSTAGYIINDVLTFQQGNGTNTANIYFGCGTTQTGNLNATNSAVDGLMGFGQAAVSVPTQLADQGKAGRVFAHCLVGDSQPGGGSFIIGNILEPDIAYTPQITGQSHYNVGMQNIAVNGVNITSPAAFDITNLNAGVILDSGTTLATLAEPAYTDFQSAIVAGAPVPVSPQDGLSCWLYPEDPATTFPAVTLYFDTAVMNLAPENYLIQYNTTNGAIYQCLGWFSSSASASSPAVTIWGDIVLKDQLVVYDNESQRIGWKPFNCSNDIIVGT